MKRVVYILLLALIVASCGTKKKITHTEYSDTLVVKKDSIVTEYVETIRDTTIYLPADSSAIEALLECDSLGRVYIKEILDLKTGKRVKPDIQIRDNIITLSCTEEDSIAIALYYKDIYERLYIAKVDSLSTSTVITDEVIITRSPWYLRLWWIWIILAAVIGIAVKLFLKR